MDIKFVRIHDKIRELKCNALNLTVVDDYQKDCTIMRVQLQTTLSFTSQSGPFVKDAHHDDICCALLKKEQQAPSDVVIFPEYCISYNLIDKIVSNEEMRPKQGKLWCLPCQGISFNDFIGRMSRYEASGALIINDAYVGTESLQDKFINALIYCFISTDADDHQRVTLVPQIKTQAMRDPTYQCEEPYMYCGSTIFVFGKLSGIGLISLLCADSFNPKISWNAIEDQARNFIILHPQLNTNPRQEDFCRIRNDMFAQNEEHVYISCNWAKGTNIVDNSEIKQLCIHDSWSCIYYKYDSKYNKQSWYTWNLEQLKINASTFLYAGIIQEKKVVVWYAASCALAHRFILQKPYHKNRAILQSHTDVIIKSGLILQDNKWIEVGHDREATYRNELYKEFFDDDYEDIFKNIIENEKYNWPYTCNHKDDSDSFLELAYAKDTLTNRCISTTEELLSPSYLINTQTIGIAKETLVGMYTLVCALEKNEFPKHLNYYKDNHRFKLIRNKNICTNLSAVDGKNQMIVAIAKDKEAAERFIKHTRETHLIRYSGEDNASFNYLICVYVKILILGNYDYYPKFNPSTSTSDRISNHADITKGGTDHD